MLYLFNNCNNEDHLGLYGGNAFFDLWTVGKEAHIPNELRPGDICWVASYEDKSKRRVVLAKYAFTGVRRVPSSDAPGRSIWVLDGDLERREVLPKHEAAQHYVCSKFFNKRGDFKQVSVLRVGEQEVERERSHMAEIPAAESPAGMPQIEETMQHHGSKAPAEGAKEHSEGAERWPAQARANARAAMWRDVVNEWCKVGMIFVALLTVIAAFAASSTLDAIMALAIGGGVLVLFYRITRESSEAPGTSIKLRQRQ